MNTKARKVKADYQRRYVANLSDHERKAYWKKYRHPMSPEQKMKANERARLRYAQRQGKVSK